MARYTDSQEMSLEHETEVDATNSLLLQPPNNENATSNLSETKDAFHTQDMHRTASETEPNLCRICRCEESDEEPLFYPCLCSGSIKHVHRDCLVRWIREGRHNKRWCELCGYEFEFERCAKGTLTAAAKEDVNAWTTGRLTTLSEAAVCLMLAMGAQIALLIAIYRQDFLVTAFALGSVAPGLYFLRSLFVLEVVYSLYFEMGNGRPWRDYLRIPSVRQLASDQLRLFACLAAGVHLGVVVPCSVGIAMQQLLSPLYAAMGVWDAVCVGQLFMFAAYSVLRLALEWLRLLPRVRNVLESVCFFKVALLVFFTFYAMFGLVVDVFSFPLSRGSLSTRMASSSANPLAAGALYFLVGSEIVHFMSNPLVVGHFRRGVSFFRPLTRNGHVANANVYSVPFLLLFIYGFSCAVRRLFPGYGPVRLLSDTESAASVLDELALLIMLKKTRVASFKPFSTTVFTRVSAWAVRRLAVVFRLSSYLYGGRFPAQEGGVGSLAWVPKRNEFYGAEQLSVARRTPVRIGDLRVKKMELPGDAAQLAAGRSPPDVHASFDVCFLPEPFSRRLSLFGVACLATVTTLFALFVAVSVSIGWQIVEALRFRFRSDFFAYFFGRAFLKLCIMPFYFAYRFFKTRSPFFSWRKSAIFLFFGFLLPALFMWLMPTSWNPFTLFEFGVAESAKESVLHVFKAYVTCLVIVSFFLNGPQHKLAVRYFCTAGDGASADVQAPAFFCSSLRSVALTMGAKMAAIAAIKGVTHYLVSRNIFRVKGLSLEESVLFFYTKACAIVFILCQIAHSVKTANKEKASERLENMKLKNYSEPLSNVHVDASDASVVKEKLL